MTSTSLSPTQSLLSLFSSLHAAQPTIASSLSSIHSGLLSALQTNSAIPCSLLRLLDQINSQKPNSKSLVPPHTDSIRYIKRVFTAMALVIIILSILVRKNAKGMLPLHLSPLAPIPHQANQASVLTSHVAMRKDALNCRTEVPITKT